jgi:hypothetical protein
MGVLGWNEIRDGQQLTGEVTRHIRAGDGDRCLYIVPDASRLLRNQAGRTNQDGTVEGEVEPNDDIDNDAMEAQFFDPLVGQRVIITGTFVEDKSHDDKTEIHPITSIFVDWGIVESVKRVEFFVFSDDSANFPANVPHSGENRTGEFKVGYPPTLEADVIVPRCEVIEL